MKINLSSTTSNITIMILHKHIRIIYSCAFFSGVMWECTRCMIYIKFFVLPQFFGSDNIYICDKIIPLWLYVPSVTSCDILYKIVKFNLQMYSSIVKFLETRQNSTRQKWACNLRFYVQETWPFACANIFGICKLLFWSSGIGIGQLFHSRHAAS